MSGRRIAISALIAAGACGLALSLLWAICRRLGLEPGGTALIACGAGALAAGYLDNRLHRRAAALEAIAASLLAVLTAALVGATEIGGELLAPITDGLVGFGEAVLVTALAALAGAQLGARHAGRSRRRIRAVAAALIYAGTFAALLCGYLFSHWFFDGSPLWPALAFAVMFGSPFWAGLALVFAFGARAYRAATAGAFLCGAHLVAVAVIAELGVRLHAGEIAAIAALVAGAVALISRVAHSAIDAVIGRGWTPPDDVDGAELPRATVRATRDPGENA